MTLHTAPSLATLICNYLKDRPGEWVAMPTLARLAPEGMHFAVHSRIAELRRRFGMDIRNKVEVAKDTGSRVRHSFYMFIDWNKTAHCVPPPPNVALRLQWANGEERSGYVAGGAWYAKNDVGPDSILINPPSKWAIQ
jgi:hypothetical protein